MKTGKREKLEYLEFNDLRYCRYADREEEHGRGEVIIPGSHGKRFIRDYPHICRVFSFGEGIRRYFGSGHFYAEEKLDGYNIRIVKHNNSLLAITRGGIICPFTTEWAGYWRTMYPFDELFAAYPGASLCAELLGDSPYNSKRDESLPPGLSFFCFDIMKPDGTFVPVEEKYAAFEKYGLPSVPSFGRFSASQSDELRAVILDLNSRRREGLVMKKPGSDGAIKFVTAESDLADLELFIPYYYDIEPGFYSSRIMRVSLFVREFGLDRGEYESRLGGAIMKGYPVLAAYEGSYENFTIYVHTPLSWRMLKKIILKHSDIVNDELEKTSSGGVELYRITFKRKHRKSTIRFREILSGHAE